jgi:NADP-dependent 3-hydroxy acid dehydrogenase YdfG
MKELDGKVAIVTGAGSGIGRETALLLAGEGAKVVLVGRRPEPLAGLAAEIAARGAVGHARALDITDRAAALELVAWTAGTLGPADLLVNNAGSASRVLNARWISQEEWDATVALNLGAVFTLTQAVLPAMLTRGGGTIITVSSLAALNPNLLGGAAYGAAKAGVRNFMQFLHNTYRNQGIRATTILPGEVDTPIMEARARPPTAAERERMLDPGDVARAVLLCAGLPPRAVVPELTISPTWQRDTSADIETARWVGAPAETPDLPEHFKHQPQGAGR